MTKYSLLLLINFGVFCARGQMTIFDTEPNFTIDFDATVNGESVGSISGNEFSAAQGFSGYYDGITATCSEELKTELSELIDGHTVESYSSLWTHYQVTDDHLNDAGDEVIVWDMYSDNPSGAENEFTFVIEQCGNYQMEGDCYNREHTFPKSWWGGSTSQPQYTDLFVVVPSDGWVNGVRSNFPYGEVLNGTETQITDNGCKVGTSSVTIPGYSDSVFEPIDDYKGDLARGYFYMATRYQSQIASWESNTTASNAVLDGSSFIVFEPWMIDLLIDWHASDPVDQKEIDRNEAIFMIQGNRNPFIDHPEYVGDIWNGCTIDSCIYVSTIADNGPGSLRSAVACAEDNEVITFSPDIHNSTITLNTSSIIVDKNITFEVDPGANILVSSVIPHVPSLETIFLIENGSAVTFKGLQIDGGYGIEGSAIRNEGILVLEDMILTKGNATGVNSVLWNNLGSTLTIRNGVEIREN